MLSMLFPAAILSIISGGGKAQKALIIVTSVNLLLVIFSFLVEYASRALCLHGIRLVNTMQLDMNRKTMHMNYADIKESSYINKYDTASDGIWKSSDTVHYLFRVILSRVVMISATLFIFIRVHFAVAAVVFATIIFDYAMNAHIVKKQHANDTENAVYRNRQKYLDDTLFDQNVQKDASFNSANAFLLHKRKELTKSILQVVRKNTMLDFTDNTIGAACTLVRTVFTYLIALKQYIAGKLHIADFLLFISAAQQMTDAFFQMVNAAEYIRKAVNYCDDYLKYMEIPETDRTEGNLEVPKHFHVLEFRNVSFKYPGRSEYVLRNLSFTVNTNEVMAIVGDNGAGKSTLVKLLLRLYKPSSGEILLDGVSIHDYRYDDYTALFAPVFQDYMTYSFTVGENIYFGNTPASAGANADLYKILDKVGLKDKISALPEGLDTPYTKRFDPHGIVFSGGEEQRLVIARAFAKAGAGSMILDEPTASLDPLAEYEINKLIHSVAADDFLIFISHRLSTTKFADKIIVLQNGEPAEEGSHADLMGLDNGIYKTMYCIQSSYYTDETMRMSEKNK